MAHGSAACERVPPLAGWTVGVTAHRRAEEQAELLRRRGAAVVLGPVVRTLPFGDDRPLKDATDDLVRRPPDLLVATTGIGMRSWFGAAETWGLDRALARALGGARAVARGPKARAALSGLGFAIDGVEPSERLEHLVGALTAAGLCGLRVAIQLYGEDVPWAVERLRAAGADVVAVPVYRWTRAEDLAPARRLIEEAVAERLDVVTFTSAAAVRTFAALADETGALADLRRALSSTTLAACVGPVTAEAAARAGFERRCAPARGRLGLLVRTLSDDLGPRHRHLRSGGHDVVVQGSSVWAGDDQVTLTDLERALLAVLAERPGATVSRLTLRRRVWAGRGGDSAIDSGLSRLRKTLAGVRLRVHVVPRRGWALDATDAACPRSAAGALAG